MSGGEASDEGPSKVLKVSDWCLFYQSCIYCVFSWCFVFHFLQVQLYFMGADRLCDGVGCICL